MINDRLILYSCVSVVACLFRLFHQWRGLSQQIFWLCRRAAQTLQNPTDDVDNTLFTVALKLYVATHISGIYSVTEIALFLSSL